MNYINSSWLHSHLWIIRKRNEYIFWIWNWKCTLSSFNYETLWLKWNYEKMISGFDRKMLRFSKIILNVKISTFYQSCNLIVIYDSRLFFPSSKNSIVFEVTNVPTATWETTLFTGRPDILFPVRRRRRIDWSLIRHRSDSKTN